MKQLEQVNLVSSNNLSAENRLPTFTGVGQAQALSSAVSRQRLYYLDAMRGILMMAGVLLHSAFVFSAGHEWIVKSEDGSLIAYYIVELIHYFRMPAFFVVSGLFCLLTLQRYSLSTFVNVRLKRIIVPLVATALTLNVMQYLFVSGTNFEAMDISRYLSSRRWISHLWFLNYLVLYFVLAAIFFRLSAAMSIKTSKKFLQHAESRRLALLLLLLPLYTLALKTINKLYSLDIFVLKIFQVFDLVYYLQFFIVGYWLMSRPAMLRALVSTRLLYLTACGMLGVVVYKLWGGSESYLQMVIREYSTMIFVWSAIAICFAGFYRIANTPSAINRFLAEASYSVYLFHHLIVIVLASWLIEINADPVLLMVVLSTAALAASALIHVVFVRRSRLLRFMFNGK